MLRRVLASRRLVIGLPAVTTMSNSPVQLTPPRVVVDRIVDV